MEDPEENRAGKGWFLLGLLAGIFVAFVALDLAGVALWLIKSLP